MGISPKTASQLDMILARYEVDPLEVVDTVRDEVRAFYDILDGWHMEDGSAVSQALVSMRRAEDTEEDDKVTIDAALLSDWIGAVGHLQSDVSDVLERLRQTKDDLDEALQERDR